MAGAVILALSVLMVYINVPVLTIWIVICFIKMVIERNWAMAGLIAATALIHDEEFITKNQRDFRFIAGLNLLSYP